MFAKVGHLVLFWVRYFICQKVDITYLEKSLNIGYTKHLILKLCTAALVLQQFFSMEHWLQV
jgi:hypothetical protein